MPIIIPPNARHSITHRNDKLEIIIPPLKNWFQIIYIFFVLVTWFVSELAAIGIFVLDLTPNALGELTFLSIAKSLLVLIVWTSVGSLGIYILLWQLVGKEKIIISEKGFCIRHEIFGKCRPKEYLAKYISALRVSPNQPTYSDRSIFWEFWGFGMGTLAFDYGAKTFRFGIRLDEAEARQIFNQIQLHFPKYLKEF